MRTIIVFSLLVASCLCYPGWGSGQQGHGGSGQNRGISRQQGGWNGNQGAGWSGNHQGGGAQGRSAAWGQQGQGGGAQGRGGAWGQQGQGAGWRGGRNAYEDGQYGGTIIDSPDMYGYEATIPGAHSKFISYRGARSGSGPSGRGYDQQGGQGQGSSGHTPWPQGGHHY